jgi:hypothetical protein
MVAPNGAPTETVMMREVIYDAQNGDKSEGGKTTAIYDQIVKPLPTPERFKLAQLILSDIPSCAVVDYSEEWTEEDIREFSEWSWRYILERVEREEKEG